MLNHQSWPGSSGGAAVHLPPLAIDPIHVLIVDDEPSLLSELVESFENAGFIADTASSVDAAIAALSADTMGSILTILTDIRMPGHGGLALAEYVHQVLPQERAVEVVVMTGHGNFELAVGALRAHAFDFVNKPMRTADLVTIIRRAAMAAQQRRAVALRSMMAAIETRRADDRAAIAPCQDALLLEHAAVNEIGLEMVARLVEQRDPDTGHHIQRTQAYVDLLITCLRQHPAYALLLANEAYCRAVVKAAPLHDLGKIGIPDSILLKPGRLTPDEFAIMKTHAASGARTIESAMSRMDLAAEDDRARYEGVQLFLKVAAEIALSHHEKWDGSGYPHGLAGDAIPLTGRIMALADVFDALLSERPYKSAMPDGDALEIIRQGRGAHFDPVMTDVFLEHQDGFLQIKRFFDTAPAPAHWPLTFS